MRYCWLILCSAMVLLGCQDVQRPEKPKNLIPQDKMVEVLTEAYLVNASQSVRNQALFAQEIDLDSLLYAKFDIDSVQFAKSNDYYAVDVSTYIEILEKVEANLERYEESMDSVREKSIQKRREIEAERARIRAERSADTIN